MENSGVADGGIVGVKTTRLAKRVDSECWECILRVARWIEEGERSAIEGITLSEVSRDRLIYERKQIINHYPNIERRALDLHGNMES